MKKLLSMLLVAIISFSLVSCGQADKTEPTTETQTEVACIEIEDVLSENGAYRQYTYSDHVLNDKGQVISRKVSGDSRRTDTFEYDDEGRVVKNIRSSSYGDEIWTYTYDENGLLVEEFQGDRTFKNTYELDNQDRIITKTMVNADSDYTLVYSYTYNDDGTVETETQKSPNSTYVLTFTYDEKGRVVKSVSVKEGETAGITTNYVYGVVGTYTPVS